jgi:hypothetical protein
VSGSVGRWARPAERPTAPTGRRLGLVTAVAALAVGVLAGCGGDTTDLPDFKGGGSATGASTAPAGTSKGSSSPTSSPSVVSEDGLVTVILAAGSSKNAEKLLPSLQGYVGDLAKAMAEPADPPRSRFATPSGQAIIDGRAEDMRKAKISLVGPVTVTAQVRVRGSQASVDGCLDQSKVKARDAQGKAVSVEQPQRVKIRALLLGRGSSWRAESFSVPRSGICEA